MSARVGGHVFRLRDFPTGESTAIVFSAAQKLTADKPKHLCVISTNNNSLFLPLSSFHKVGREADAATHFKIKTLHFNILYVLLPHCTFPSQALLIQRLRHS